MHLGEIRQFVSHLESLRAPRLARQREIGRLILPSRGLFQGEDAENPREANLFNPAANRALRKAAAGMTQAVTPASVPWFRHAFLRREDYNSTPFPKSQPLFSHFFNFFNFFNFKQF